MGATALAYLARPWSCTYALSRFTAEAAVPYAYFDYHGIGVLFAWLAALIFAAPILGLAREVFLDRTAAIRIFGRGPDAKTTVASILIALAIAAPMHSQLSYLLGLPISVSAPVVVSSLAWLLMVEIGRTAAVEGRPLSKRAIRLAVVVALLVTVPKLALIGDAAING
jgi:hypothetical protein